VASWSDRLQNKWTRPALIVVMAALLVIAVALVWFALGLSARTTTDKAARLQALAAAGALLASIVLTIVTTIYVILTRDMVGEAREARLDAVRPSLAIRIDPVGPVDNVFTLVSTGQGTAIDIDISIKFHALQHGGYEHEVPWRSPSLGPGDFAQFMPKNAAGQVELNTQTIVGLFSKVTVIGTMRDAIGRTHGVNLIVDDMPEWQALLARSSQRYLEPPLEKIAKTLENIEKKLR
jgi:hypothetical protein